MLRNYILLLFMLAFAKGGISQCITTFPNTENFENAAIWTTGGTNSDWAWGTPTKGVITSAGGGSNCWIVGGLVGSTYNSGEKSYIESPCYNFSTLAAPYVSFKVFWEIERQYDGASLLYSLNNGVTWALVGGFNNQANCMTQNWYNYGNINYLAWSNTGGWSGNSKPTSGGCQGGFGSLGWVTAKHCLSGLAGKTNVKFRFNFGSGTSCNSFDGFAIDDFTIADAGSNSTSFTYTCSNFSTITTTCSTSTILYQWDFGEPTSGASNTSTLSAPSHTYNASGVYTVSLTTTGGLCNAVGTNTQLVSVIGSSVSSTASVTCFGGHDGEATVLAAHGNPAYSYTWMPYGGSSATASSLTAGNYTVIIKDVSGCINSNTVSIIEPVISTGVSTKTVNVCLDDNIVLEINTSGIKDPITYLWLPGGFTSNSISISPTITTTYSANITVTGNCPINEQKRYTVVVSPKPLVLSNHSDSKGCAPLCISFVNKSTTSLGSITSNTWSFANSLISHSFNPIICFDKEGIYSGKHSVTNSYGCTNVIEGFITVTVFPTPTAQFQTDNKDISELNALVNFKDVSTASPIKWEWNFGGMAVSNLKDPTYNFNTIGSFPVLLTVSNNFGCTNTTLQLIKVLPEFTFFVPNTFTPNGDGLNDVFLPSGMGWDISTYNFYVYDRFGQQLFSTTDYTKGWNGYLNGSTETAPLGDYIYKVTLNDNYKKLHEFVGFIVILK